jgi:parallel beta-helix repeat protein
MAIAAGFSQRPPGNPTPAIGAAFYVSTEGNDAWSGKLANPNPPRTDGPFGTLARARDAIRELKARGPLHQPLTVYVRGGTYFLDAPLVFLPEDSGTAACVITYAAYPGESPVVSGGRVVPGWFGPGEGGGASLRPVVAPSPHFDFAALGSARPVWATRLPEVEAGKWYFHELFVNGQRRQRARLPHAGFFRVDGQILPDDPARFKFHPGDIRGDWAKQGDVEVVALVKWAEFRMLIKSVDPESRTVTLSARRQPFGDDMDARYWVENAADALDAPGEWYLNRHDGMLYYWTLPGDDLTGRQVIAPRLAQLVRFEGDAKAGRLVHDITLRGLTFAHTDWSMPSAGYVDTQAAYDVPAAIELAGARNCSFQKCVFVHLGQYALEVHKGSKGNRIVGNEMTDLGAGGVKIGDPQIPGDEREATSGTVVRDNRIHNIGTVYPAAVGVWIAQSGGNTVAHNEIADTFYTAISVGWTWGYGPTAARDNLIEFNNLHDIGRGMLSDMGCIYTLGIQPGTIERNNLCHDVTRDERGYGGWGIYTDEGSSQIVIENNVVFRAQDGGFHQHYGRENTVRNNIFALGQTAEIRRTRQEPHRSFTFEHNIVYWKEGPLLDGKWDDDQYFCDYNLYYRADGKPVRFANWSLEEWQKRGQDVHAVVADPLFVDPDHANFTLKPASPASRIGFRPINLSHVGPLR